MAVRMSRGCVLKSPSTAVFDCSHGIIRSINDCFPGGMVLRAQIMMIKESTSAHMASELLSSDGMKNLSHVDKIFLCFTVGTAFIAMVCVVLMNS